MEESKNDKAENSHR